MENDTSQINGLQAASVPSLPLVVPNHIPRFKCRSPGRSNSVQADDEFVPFDAPVMSKFGPISRNAKTLVGPGAVPATMYTDPGRRPLPPASPMGSVLLHNVQGKLRERSVSRC